MNGRELAAQSRSVASASTRRGVMHLLSALPLVGMLRAFYGNAPAAAR